MQRWSVEQELSTEIVGVQEVSARLVSGEVAIAATDGPARLEVTDVRNGAVEVTFDDGLLTVSHEQFGEHGRRRGLAWLLGGGPSPAARITIGVPAGTRVGASSVAADMLVAGLSEPVNLKTVSGDITLKDLTERVDARTVAGDVEAFGIAGDLNVGTVSGDLAMVNGTCRWLESKTVSGDILLDLALPRGAVYTVATVSGDVALRLPSEPSLIVEAASLSGDLRSDWDIGWESTRPGRRRVRTTLGTGDGRLVVKTVSGDLQILSKRAAA
jgi:hypothetical protein